MTGAPVTIAGRHQTILGWLTEEGRVDVLDLAGRLRVAAETVRRDLRTLETAGKLQRVHGGAVALDGQRLTALNLHPVSTADVWAGIDPDDRAVGTAAWSALPRAGTVLLGSGRLTTAVAHAVAQDPPEGEGLTVVTTSLDAAVILSRVTGVAVYNVGGTVAPLSRGQEGDWALEELRRLHVDVSVVAPAGLGAEAGLSELSHAAAAVGQAEVACADRVLALTDAFVLGRSALVRFAPIDRVDEVLVAGPPSARAVDDLTAAGIRVRVFAADSSEHRPTGSPMGRTS